MKTELQTESPVVFVDRGFILCNFVVGDEYVFTDDGCPCHVARELWDWRTLQMAVYEQAHKSMVPVGLIQQAMLQIEMVGVEHELGETWEKQQPRRTFADLAVIVLGGAVLVLGFALWGLG